MDDSINQLDDLQKKKIELEIKELKTPWPLKPNYLRLFITVIITGITIYWTIVTGIFDLKYQTLQNDKILLEIKKDSISKEVNKYIDSLVKVKAQLELKEESIIKLYKEKESKDIERLTIEKRTNEITRYYKNKLDSLILLSAKIGAIHSVLLTENGQELLTEDGQPLLN